jgi:hypothetical protein
MSEKQDATKGKDSNEGAEFIVGVILAVGLLYVGGWSPLWQEKMFRRQR